MDIIIDKSELNIKDTLECGQFFRYRDNGTSYTVRSLDKTAVLYYNGSNTVIESDDSEYFYNFFDLNTDYHEIKRNLYDMPFMKDAIDNAPALRILRQDPTETIFNFIISANNHIPRIKAIIERLCQGDAFPSIDTLANYPLEFYSLLGAGYRDTYLFETAKKLNDDKTLINSIYHLDTPTAEKKLCSLKGVGTKVADCILLFGYYRMDTFPVDTWIKKVYKDIFGLDDNPRIIHDKLIAKYGHLSGYAQQYLFYNKRSMSKNDIL